MAMVSNADTEHSYELTPSHSDKKNQPLRDPFYQIKTFSAILILRYATVCKINFNKRYHIHFLHENNFLLQH